MSVIIDPDWLAKHPGALTFKAKATGPGAKAYPAVPGSGPTGETCKTCANLARVECSKTYLKCRLMEKFWTGGPGTDVKARSPACEFWQKKEKNGENT